MAKKYIFQITDIKKNLQFIDDEYQKVYIKHTQRNVQLMKIYSKIAVINLCGWIEDGLKELGDLSMNKLSKQRSIATVKDATKYINGFSYQDFSKMLMLTFGIHGLEFIETNTNDKDIDTLKSSLGNLKAVRNSVAHSHVNTIQYSPNKVILELNKIAPILKKVEKSAKLFSKRHF